MIPQILSGQKPAIRGRADNEPGNNRPGFNRSGYGQSHFGSCVTEPSFCQCLAATVKGEPLTSRFRRAVHERSKTRNCCLQ